MKISTIILVSFFLCLISIKCQKVNGDTGLYLDKSLTYALYEKFNKDMYAAYTAIGNMEGLDVEVSSDGVATLITREIWHGWHGASLAQVPPPSATQSYFNFQDVEVIKFKIKSTDVKATEIKFFMQPISNGNLLEKTIAELGANDISDWKEITVKVASYKTIKMKVAMALCLSGGELNRKIYVKEIGFLTKDGKNADIKSTIVWPKDLGSTAPPENAMPIGTKIKKNGISLTLEWADEFIQDDNSLPDNSKWGYDVGNGMQTNTDGTFTNNVDWGNGEKQWYTYDNIKNAFISDGTLKIKAIREKKENKEWTSSRMVTRNLKEFKYGYFEFRVKLPTSAGFWPAIWMLRHDIYDEGGAGWPKGGEIDILESSVSIWGLGKVYGTLHCDAGHSGNPIYSQGLQMVDIGGKWHTYGIYWKEDSISWYYDDQLVGKYKPTSTSNNAVWPFNQNFFIIMNLAVGGNLGGEIPNNVDASQMEVDYVRVFKAEGDGNEGDNGAGNPPEAPMEDVKYEIDENIKSPIGLVVSDKGDGVVDIVWGNDPSIQADIYVVYVDGKKAGESGIPRVVTVTVDKGGEHVFGVAAIRDGKSSKPTTMTLNIKK